MSVNALRTLLVIVPLATLAAGVMAAQSPANGPATLSLGDAARLAAHNSAQVEAAQFDVDQAEAIVHQRQQDLLPTYSATALQSGRTFNTVTFGLNFPTAPGQPPLFDPRGQVEGPVNTIDLRAHVDAALIDPAARQRVQGARTAVDAALANSTSTADAVAGQAAFAYVQVLRAEAELDSKRSDSTLAAGLLGIAQDQLSAGVGVALDVTRAQAQLANVRSQLIAARNAVALSRVSLLRTLGLSLDSPVQLTDSLTTLPLSDSLPSESGAVATAMSQRPDVRAIEAQIAVVSQQVSAIQAGRLPTLGLFADDGWLGGNVLHLLPTYTYGIQLSVPLFDGKRRADEIEQQTALSNQLHVRERDLRQQILLDVRSAMLTLASAREQVASAKEQVDLGDQEVAEARDRFTAGVAGNADVITASLSLTQAHTLLVEALAEYQSARVALAHAEGTVTELK